MNPRRSGEGVRRTEREIADPAERERLAHEHERARQAALVARRTLLIQREALGLRQHRVVDQLYPEPPRLPGS